MKYLFLAFLFPCLCTNAQNTQDLSGVVSDMVSHKKLEGVLIYIVDKEQAFSTTSDRDGKFKFSNVPLGRHSLVYSFLGYNTFQSEAILLTSAKSLHLEIELQEGVFSLNEIVVAPNQQDNEPVNNFAFLSARSFSADETDRIAASVNDPGRMALAYAGVTQGTDDNENEILIRGNSAFGMLWRLEGVDIPNPNHFARVGTSGGGITAFSNQVIKRSDFFTGAMPASYGNALSGAMDVQFRKGSNTNAQHRFKFGLLGLELGSEGPIKRSKSSYLFNYRYSTLGILSSLGINIFSSRRINIFQDLSFNFAFNPNEKHQFTVWGLGGLSKEQRVPVDNPLERDSLELSHFEDRFRNTDLGIIGATYKNLINDKSSLKISLAGVGSRIARDYYVLDENNNRFNQKDERHIEKRLVVNAIYTSKLNQDLLLKAGLQANYIIDYEFFRKSLARELVLTTDPLENNVLIDGRGSTFTLQPYALLQKQINRLTFNVGAHFLYLGLNNTSSIEPRLSMQYRLDKQKTVSIAYGIYSKHLPLGTYFFRDATGFPNRKIPLIKSQHLIAAYKQKTKTGWTFSTEVYFQRLKDVPVALNESDFFWMLNNRNTLIDREVVSDGKGENYGLDLAVEKFFSNQFFFLVNGSIFRSFFYPKNGERYHTNFSGNFASTLTTGREFRTKKGNRFQVGTRIIYNGGHRYSPLNFEASMDEMDLVPDFENFNSLQIPNYFRIDTRVAYQFNTSKTAGTISLDIQNVLNKTNYSGVNYIAETNALDFDDHSGGLVPVLAFELDF